MKKNVLLPMLVLVLGGACDKDPLSSGLSRAYKSVDTGGEHTCAVATDGAAYCWGRGLDGELGIGAKENRTSPARVVGSIGFASITTGENHSCGLGNDGSGYCWGWNAFYQRGNPDDPREAEPVPLATAVRFRSIDAGAHHTCAISLDSLAYCWGSNRYGQAGDGTTNTVIAPKAVQGGIKFVQISGGARHTCGVASAGAVYCWGANEFGQLGASSDVVFSTLALPVSSAIPFAQVSAGESHTCGTARDGRFFCWGSNEFGELGNGTVFKPGLPAANVPGAVSNFFPNGLSISAGDHHTCAVGPAGLGACWGRGILGQLANGSNQDHYVPQPVRLQPTNQQASDLLKFTSFAAGGTTHACGLADQSVFCWGTGRAGQLGVAGSTFAPLPQRVAND